MTNHHERGVEREREKKEIDGESWSTTERKRELHREKGREGESKGGSDKNRVLLDPLLLVLVRSPYAL